MLDDKLRVRNAATVCTGLLVTGYQNRPCRPHLCCRAKYHSAATFELKQRPPSAPLWLQSQQSSIQECCLAALSWQHGWGVSKVQGAWLWQLDL